MPIPPENHSISRENLSRWWPQRGLGLGFCIASTGESDAEPIALVLPGSFNPLHTGHLAMAETAAERLGVANCYFEISISNVDKPPLEQADVVARMNLSFEGHGLIVSNAARFAEKSTLYPGAVFAVGADTILRLGDVKYHDGCEQKQSEAVEQIKANGCRFLIFGRLISNKFVDAENIELDDGILEMCDFVPRDEFEAHISSSSLRKQNRGG